jgi:Sec-independent protein translocase protein TatA
MSPFALIERLGPMDLAILAGVALLLLGNRIPRVMRQLRDRFHGDGPFAIP